MFSPTLPTQPTLPALPDHPTIGRLTRDSLWHAISYGWQSFLLTRTLSVSYAMIFALPGMAMQLAVAHASFAPMIVPLAGGFMLLGPILLSGYFALAERIDRQEPAGFRDIVAAFRRTSTDQLTLAVVCAILFVVWVSDAALLYGSLLGGHPASLTALLAPAGNTLAFLLASS
ncbi:MAG: DUF2189 domain-containing protein, partial [Propionivibrio sp.]